MSLRDQRAPSADLDWERAWKMAAPVIVAAGRFLDAEASGIGGLIEDAHFQLLGAVTQYKAEAVAALSDSKEEK